jgi:hypothetical protein
LWDVLLLDTVSADDAARSSIVSIWITPNPPQTVSAWPDRCFNWNLGMRECVVCMFGGIGLVMLLYLDAHAVHHSLHQWRRPG